MGLKQACDAPSQLRDSAGFPPAFPRYLRGLTPRGTG